MLAEKAKHVIGIDYDSKAIEYCKTNYSAPNIEFIQADAAKLQNINSVDVMISFQLIEHLVSADDFIIKLKGLAKPGGLIILSTPNCRIRLRNENPFHISEMSYLEFKKLRWNHFRVFNLYGIGFASEDLLKKIVIKTPLYGIGRLLRRRSNIKKLLTKATGMNKFKILESDIDKNAIDLLAICTNEY